MTLRLGRSGAILVICLALAGTAIPSYAQSAPPGGSIRLVNQTNWVTPGQPFTMDFQVQNSLSPDQSELAITVFNALPNRSSFQQSLDDHISTSSFILERHALTDVMDASGLAHVNLPVGDPTQRRDYLRDGGVYPVRVELRESATGRVIDKLVTHIINEPTLAPAASRLSVATVIPVQAPPSDNPGDPFRLPDNGASTGVLARSMAAQPTLPVTLVPEPETVERMSTPGNQAANNSLSALANTAPADTIVGSTWAPLPAAMYTGDLSAELNSQFDRGSKVLGEHFGKVDNVDWVATEPIDNVGLTNLAGRGVNRIVVPETQLSPIQRDTTLARPFALSLGKYRPTMPATQADAGLTAHFNDRGGAVLAAHRTLADLAVIWNDRPGQTRAVAIMSPRNWTPDQQFLDVLFGGLTTSPVVAPVNLDQLFSTPAEPGSGRVPLVRQLAQISKTQAATIPTSRVNDTRKRLNGYATVLTNPAPADLLQRRLMYSESADTSTKQRSSDLDTIRSMLDKQLSAIHMPAERSIRLTARAGEIPVSIQNDTGSPIKVMLRLTSDKLAFPNGNTRLLTVERKNDTEQFAVDARTSGAFPVQVWVGSPDGSLVLVRSKITVRSTAASGVGVALTISAVLFLVLWWARSLLKSHRARRNTPYVGSSPA